MRRGNWQAAGKKRKWTPARKGKRKNARRGFVDEDRHDHSQTGRRPTARERSER